jgi:predicted extracellular nuclease
MATTPNALDGNNPTLLRKIGGFSSANGAEIPAFDPGSDRLFVVAGSTVEILNFSNPAAPTLIGTLEFGFTPPTGFAAIPNSVAVKNGVVAVAYAITNSDTEEQLPGRVSLYSTDGTLLNSIAVGSLPDMLTFTPDGSKILTANEGQPNQAYTIDPEGSISIIDLSAGAAHATVQTAGFTQFNSQIDALRAAGVRIIGPNATVAQDVEPEYIAFSGDGTQAYVTLQENNALAIVDLATATVTEIKPLGLKHHNQPTVMGLETYAFTNLPTLGTTAAGQPVPLGGFSGLHFEGYAANGNLKFITHTDRGPNGEATGSLRPFLLPDFVPEVIRFELNRTTGQLTLTDRIQLQAAPGDPLSGLPNTAIPGGTGNTSFNDEIPIDLRGNTLPRDPLGADLEGIVVAPDGTFWMVDEYRPAIYQFDATGVLIDRFIPVGTAAAAGQPAGTFGKEVLPAVLGQRRQNRGFEAVAFQDGKVYAFVQSPIRNPETLSNSTLNGLQNIRIVEFDPTTRATRQFLYVMDNPPASGATDTRADKIGDAVAIGNGEFLVVERDDDAIDSDPLSQIQKKVYRFSLQDATEITNLPNLINGKSLDQMTAAELTAAGVTPIRKTLHVDLSTAGYNQVEKVEGLTIIDRNTIAVINDNDFTVAGITIDQSTGTFTPDPNAETPILGLIHLQNNGLDASDRDSGINGGINIRNQPVFGLYQPDAIASFTANGQTYFVTANEGDARDYDGFAEEVRVGASSYRLDPATFPNAAALKNNANLGRLTVTNATGDPDGDGDFDRIEVFGSRSFSIWDSNGNRVFDSGDQFEQITAAQVPTLFNSNGAADTFDTRSDNKGPEPEGVVTAVINDRTYAFIGLERTGDVIVYEITNPTQPVFAQYINAPEDIAPEGLAFIAAKDSPTGKPLLVTANEESDTVAVFEVAPRTRISEIQGAGHRSPLVNQTVTNVPGIVTALESNGFYLQDPNPDSNAATSEGMFVFTSSRPTVRVGDAIEVTGRVSEFVPGGATSNNLSTTQITSPTITVRSSGNSLPTAVVLGVDRVPPTQVIDNDNFSVFDPQQDGIDFYESLEGMRVTVNDAVAVGPTNNFGEIFTLANNGVGATGLSDRGTINISPTDFNPERIQIQIDRDVLPGFATPQVNVGDRLGDVTGVVDYAFGNFEVKATQPFTPVSGGLQPEVSTLGRTANRLTVASFNVENLDPKVESPDLTDQTDRNRTDDVDDDLGSGKFAALAAQIVNNLKAPDIVGLQEIQDGDGTEITDLISAEATLNALIEAIVAAGGPRYQFIDTPDLIPAFVDDRGTATPSDDQVVSPVGGAPGGNIRNAFLYNPQRVSLVAGSVRLLTDPDDQAINPDNPFFRSRIPLAATFDFNGQAVTIVSNHFTSKGGSSSLFGQNQPSVERQEDPIVNGGVDQRREQAQTVKSFVNGILAKDANANVMVLGDLNEFEFISPLEILEQSLVNLTETLPENERYSYIFEGNSQSLDHILVSPNLANRAEFDAVHVNSEFAENASDHDPLLARLALPTILDGKGGQRSAIVERDTGFLNATNFGGVGRGNSPAASMIAEVDTIQFTGTGLTARNLLLTQNGSDLVISFEGIANTGAILRNFKLENLDNLTKATGATVNLANLLFNGQTSIQDSFDVFNAEWTSSQIFNRNAVTFLNDRNNNIRGFEDSNDVINAQGGDDTVRGLSGDDLVRGGAGNDRLLGGDGNDSLVGDEGNDLLNGGADNDIYRGGSGRDTFVLAARAGTDTIVDFEDGIDLLGLAGRLTFGQLTVAQGTGAQSSDTLIRVTRTGELLSTLTGIQASSITSADFTPIG